MNGLSFHDTRTKLDSYHPWLGTGLDKIIASVFGRKIDVDLTIQSFERYLRLVLFRAKTDVAFVNRSCSLASCEYDRYADAFYIVSRNEEFEPILLQTYIELSGITFTQ